MALLACREFDEYLKCGRLEYGFPFLKKATSILT